MREERFQARVVRLVATLVLINGLFAIYRPLAERIPERLESLILPVGFDYASRSLDLLLGVSLIYFSYQLLQRKLLAWRIATLIALALVVIHIATAGALELIPPVLGLGALLVSKSYFKARLEPTNVKQGILVLAFGLVLTFLYGVIGFWLMHHRDFGISFNLASAFYHSFRAFLLLGNPDLFPRTWQARWFLDSLGLIGAASIGYGLYSLFRPLTYQLQTLPAERQEVESLLKLYSTSSDDFFKIWPQDKSYYFTENHRAAIAYGVSSGVALAVGDPVASKTDVSKILSDFGQLCLTSGWSPAFIYVTGQYLKEYSEAQYDILKIGEDAVVNLTTFKTETANKKHFRNIRNRFTKDGYIPSRYLPPHPAALVNEVAAVSASWLSQPDRKEWRFLAGNFSRSYINQTPLFVIRDSSGTIQAFANEIPTYNNDYATIDLTRYRLGAPSGIMDFLYMSLMLEWAQAGVKQFNLGLAPLSGLGGAASEPEEKLLDLLYRSNPRFISLQGLSQFKAKFEPVWEPRFVAYKGGPAKLPRLALALARIMRQRK